MTNCHNLHTNTLREKRTNAEEEAPLQIRLAGPGPATGGGGSFGGIQLIVSLTLEVKSATIRRLKTSLFAWQISS